MNNKKISTTFIVLLSLITLIICLFFSGVYYQVNSISKVVRKKEIKQIDSGEIFFRKDSVIQSLKLQVNKLQKSLEHKQDTVYLTRIVYRLNPDTIKR
jgi:peptidoglycan hydrolase CwlO-like protein